MQKITDKKFEALCRKSAPVGCLAERHPDLHFAAVLKVDDKFCAVFMGNIKQLSKGTKIKLWGGAIIEA